MSKGKRLISVKLVGGPFDGRILDLPASTEKYRAGFWTYEFAGRDGAQVVFALRLKSRVARRFVWSYVGRTGKHPAIEAAYAKREPKRGKTDKRGQGARRRAEKRKVITA